MKTGLIHDKMYMVLALHSSKLHSLLSASLRRPNKIKTIKKVTYFQPQFLQVDNKLCDWLKSYTLYNN